MQNELLQSKTLSIVLIGDFNPVIIQPFWLESKKLIRETEAKKANVEVIHSDISKFDLDWVSFQITKDRFELRTSQEPYFEPLRDLIISIFEILKETPIRALGINHISNYALRDEKQYWSFGNSLSPLNMWDGILKDARLLELQIVEITRMDGLDGNFKVRITPADPELSIPYGIAFNINDHYVIPPDSSGRNNEMVTLLGKNWDYSFERNNLLIEQIWKKINHEY